MLLKTEYLDLGNSSCPSTANYLFGESVSIYCQTSQKVVFYNTADLVVTKSAQSANLEMRYDRVTAKSISLETQFEGSVIQVVNGTQVWRIQTYSVYEEPLRKQTANS